MASAFKTHMFVSCQMHEPECWEGVGYTAADIDSAEPTQGIAKCCMNHNPQVGALGWVARWGCEGACVGGAG